MSEMFTCCKKLSEVDLSSFYTKNVTDMNYMFFGCTKLKNIIISNSDCENLRKESILLLFILLWETMVII